MCRDKGLELLVDAFILLASEPDSAVRLAVAGSVTGLDEPFVAAMRQRLSEAGLAQRVSWHPNVSRADKQRLLRSFTVFSVPAVYRESFGLYVLEALACGVPVVEPDHAGLGELVRATGGGVLCAPGDPESLAAGLARLLDDPALRRELGEAGRAAVTERYSAAHMARRIAGVLEACVSRQTSSDAPDGAGDFGVARNGGR